MRSNRKFTIFKNKNEVLEAEHQALQTALLSKQYEEAKCMLQSNPKLYGMKCRSLVDAENNQFPKISLFTYMLWKHDLDGINIFMHACGDVSDVEQYNSLNTLKADLEMFNKSGTVVMIGNEKHNKHYGSAKLPPQLNINNLITQVSARMGVIRKRLFNELSKETLGY